MHKELLYALQVGIIYLLCACFNYANAFPLHTPDWTKVEKQFLAKYGGRNVYPNEHIAVVQVQNRFDLGKLTALRFIEWVQTHPTGVVGLTSGNTPEYFIKYLYYYKNNWHKPKVQAELHSFGIKAKSFPNTTNLRLVQLEEIYPVAPNHTKKISNFILRNYAAVLGLKRENLLLMDIEQRGILAEKGINIVFMNGIVDMSVLHQARAQMDIWQQRALNELQEYCKDYDRKIKQWGGIDFFVGGVTHSGHLAFNEPGGSADSKTHIVVLDYTTAADIAHSVGGIDYARGKLAITVGLGTIALKPDAVKIVIAAGVAKAEVVRNAIENKLDRNFPASMLQKFKNSRFYITDGAAIYLEDRCTERLARLRPHELDLDVISEVLMHVALKNNKRILDLTTEDLKQYARGRVLLAHAPVSLKEMQEQVHAEIIKRIEDSLDLVKTSTNVFKPKKIMHTAPHHEDIMLGYYPFLYNLKKAQNHFAFFTSGFNSVPDKYLLSALNRSADGWLDRYSNYIFNKHNVALLDRFRSQYLKDNWFNLNNLDTVFVMRNLAAAYNITDTRMLKHKIRWLKDEYFPSRQPGDIDSPETQKFKGYIRESEAERQLSIDNFPLHNIHHLRAKFYTGHEFKRSPNYKSDVLPFVNLVNKIKPDIITVYDDPHGGQLVTKNRVFQIICACFKENQDYVDDNTKIIGYRRLSISYRVHEANLYLPVSENLFQTQQKLYQTCYNTQKLSIYPAPNYEGDYSLHVIALQQEQNRQLRLLLGADYFKRHKNLEVKNARGFVFLKTMSLQQLLSRAEDLQETIDLDEAFVG